jgi:hypothetical protein
VAPRLLSTFKTAIVNRNRIRILKTIITVPGPAASVVAYCQWDATATTGGVLFMLLGRAWLCIINFIAMILIDIIIILFRPSKLLSLRKS